MSERLASALVHAMRIQADERINRYVRTPEVGIVTDVMPFRVKPQFYTQDLTNMDCLIPRGAEFEVGDMVLLTPTRGDLWVVQPLDQAVGEDPTGGTRPTDYDGTPGTEETDTPLADPQVDGAAAERIIRWAKSAIGTTEGSSRHAQIASAGGISTIAPWCGAFVMWVYSKAQVATNGILAGGAQATRPYNNAVASDPQAILERPIPGCLVVYGVKNGSTFTGSAHVHLFIGGSLTNATTIGGNESNTVKLTTGHNIPAYARARSDANAYGLVAPIGLRRDRDEESDDAPEGTGVAP